MYNSTKKTRRDNLAIMRLMLSIPGVYRYLFKIPDICAQNNVFAPGKLYRKCPKDKNSVLIDYPRDVTILLYKYALSHCNKYSGVCYACLSIKNFHHKLIACNNCNISYCNKCYYTIPGSARFYNLKTGETEGAFDLSKIKIGIYETICKKCLPYFRFLTPEALIMSDNN